MHFGGWQTEQAGATAAGGWKQAGGVHCALHLQSAGCAWQVPGVCASVWGTVIGRVEFCVCLLLL